MQQRHLLAGSSKLKISDIPSHTTIDHRKKLSLRNREKGAKANMNGTLSGGSWKIATIMGIPIRVHYSWLIVFGLITWSLSTYYFPQAAPKLPIASYWVKGALAALLFFSSICFHELAH